MFKKKIFIPIVALGILAIAIFINFKIPPNTEDIVDKISFELIDKDIDLNTDINYKIKLINSTNYKIVGSNVLFSYIKETTENGHTGNPFMVLADDTKAIIKPNESIILNVSFPADFYKEFSDYELAKANIHIVGYLKQVKDSNKIYITKSLDLNENIYKSGKN